MTPNESCLICRGTGHVLLLDGVKTSSICGCTEDDVHKRNERLYRGYEYIAHAMLMHEKHYGLVRKWWASINPWITIGPITQKAMDEAALDTTAPRPRGSE